MDLHEFGRLVEQARRRHPVWFQLESDPPAGAEAIARAEHRLGLRLPEAYRQYVSAFGGGIFAFGKVYSVTPGSDWDIARRNAATPVPRFLAVSDNGCGDLYGFQVDRGVCSDEVYFWDHETPDVPAARRFDDLFCFLAEAALRPT
jgi:hypothetical protein